MTSHIALALVFHGRDLARAGSTNTATGWIRWSGNRGGKSGGLATELLGSAAIFRLNGIEKALNEERECGEVLTYSSRVSRRHERVDGRNLGGTWCDCIFCNLIPRKMPVQLLQARS